MTNDVHVHRHGGIAGQNTDPKPPVPGLWPGGKIFSKLQTLDKLVH